MSFDPNGYVHITCNNKRVAFLRRRRCLIFFKPVYVWLIEACYSIYFRFCQPEIVKKHGPEPQPATSNEILRRFHMRWYLNQNYFVLFQETSRFTPFFVVRLSHVPSSKKPWNGDWIMVRLLILYIIYWCRHCGRDPFNPCHFFHITDFRRHPSFPLSFLSHYLCSQTTCRLLHTMKLIISSQFLQWYGVNGCVVCDTYRLVE